MNISNHDALLHTGLNNQLERSRWYGPNLLTFLTTADENNGAFTLIRCVLKKGFEPPLHIHSREDESYVIIDGEIDYQVGDQTIRALAGDYVHLPRMVPHTFRLITETVTLLLIITPGGFEKMFLEFSRPASSMSLPPVSGEKPGGDFFERMNRLNEELGVTVLPNV